MARNDQKGKSKSQKSGTKNGADKAAAEDESLAQERGSSRSTVADKGNGGGKAEAGTSAKAARAARASDQHADEAPRAAAPPPSHDHSAHGHHAPNRKEYWKIFVVLLVLTVLEVIVAQLPGIGKTTLGFLLVAMALTKAAIVALFYMHLKHETKVLRFWVAIPFAAPAVYALALIADAAWRHAK
ncbi:MAG: cytochrome C oxidase subunit IV family protein [Polyangiaceae bacterium]